MSSKTNNKSNAKLIGLKSVYAVGDEVVMTSFGRGNDAVIESRIKSRMYHTAMMNMLLMSQ